jgi:hypothetical protein
MAVRALALLGGCLLALLGLAFVLWLPELGLPLLIGGLALLALEFEWASRAQARLEWAALSLRRWLRGLPVAGKVMSAVLALAVVVAVGGWIFFWRS